MEYKDYICLCIEKQFLFYFLLFCIGSNANAFCGKRQLFMTDILPNIGLCRPFFNRFKHYLLFLQVTNNNGLICQITDFLTIQEILNFIATSKHIYSFSKINTIQIRLLKAKVDYYERPKIQPNFQTFINLLQIKVPTSQAKPKSQKFSLDHERFKEKLSKSLKKPINQQQGTKFQKMELKESKQSNAPKQLGVKNQKLTKNNSYPNYTQSKEGNQQIQKIIKNTLSANQKKQHTPIINPYYQRMQEIEYILAKEDFQRRKLKRLQQHREREEFMSIQELRKMEAQEPCIREIIKKIESQETQKIQRANRDKLKMKPIKINKNELQRLKRLQQQQKQKLVVVKQSIAQKLFTNLKSFIVKS